MNAPRNREEVINTQLAVLISKMGVVANAETIHAHGKHRPDVLFRMNGLRVAIEGKFSDHPGAKDVVLEDARRRVQAGIAHIAVAAVYPKALRSIPTAKVAEQLEKSQLKYRILSEASEPDGWFDGDLASLMGGLRRAHEALVKDDVVERTAASLSTQLEVIAELWVGQPGTCDRLSQILGINIPKTEPPINQEERRQTAAKVAALVLANAFIFQEQLSQTDGRVGTLRTTDIETELISAAGAHWRWIWENINYVPIFQMGEAVLSQLPATVHSDAAVRSLLREAISICSRQAALRHDLMGRIYHWLLHYAKYLGTYYTAVPSATLLLKLTMAMEWQRTAQDTASAKGQAIDFANPIELASFKVADLACGTGTLLMATAQAVSDLYITERVEKALPLDAKDLQTLHRALMENILHGYDVLPSALHLTASTLAMLAPQVAFVKMNLYIMPFGIDKGHARLGSLDFLETDEVKTQIALDYTQLETIRTGAGRSGVTNAKVPRLNLCVMNPPFTRSVGGNLLFGSLPDDREVLQAELRRQMTEVPANTTAGLGSVFIAVADRRLAYKGRLAFVLPAAIASGEAWSISRKLIANRYHLEMVITSHDHTRPNFSENTDLSELLFIARKLSSGEKTGFTTYVNLLRNPRTINEAVDLANRIERLMPSSSEIGQTSVTAIAGDSGKLGEIIRIPAPRDNENWTGSLFSQTQLLRTWYFLQRGVIRVPGSDAGHQIPMCKMGDLGELGYDRRDIHDAFELSPGTWTPYAAFWGHAAESVRTISQVPNNWLQERTEPAKGRRLKSASAVWSKSGKILVAERIRFNTHRCIALGFEKRVLGNTWWAFSTDDLSDDAIKALLLWLNGSLSMLLFYSRRVITEGAFVGMKKPAWASMPVLDVRALDDDCLRRLAEGYDEVSKKPFASLASLSADPTRAEVDQILSDVLGYPGVSSIRALMAREPGLTARGAESTSESVG